jgi:LysM repeat protein
VGPGDILRVVADKYGVTVEQIMAANKKTKNFAERGEKLIIPFPAKQ